jgi:uncharacterized phage-associated protein
LEGGHINILKLVKLIYLLDRLSLQRRSIPVVGGAYFSMKNGPVTSEVLDLINAGELAGVESPWAEYVSSRRNHEVGATRILPGFLSDSEIGLLEAIYNQHGSKTQWELRDWCHDHCPEWTELDEGHCVITTTEIGRAVGKSEEEIREVVVNAREASFIQLMIGCPSV